jgi:hypothetical protein
MLHQRAHAETVKNALLYRPQRFVWKGTFLILAPFSVLSEAEEFNSVKSNRIHHVTLHPSLSITPSRRQREGDAQGHVEWLYDRRLGGGEGNNRHEAFTTAHRLGHNNAEALLDHFWLLEARFESYTND